MQKKLELLAPGGDLDSIKAAIVAGADAIYCGLNKFNARNRATNIEFDDLIEMINLAHRHNCKIFLTINIIILENEIKALFKLLNRLVNTSLDGVIVQDLGLLYLLSRYFKTLPIHASTQLTTHNTGQIEFLAELSTTRVNLSRELNIHEIQELVQVGHQRQISSEVFVHGSNCICFSGLCYISSVLEGKSGNRGRCSQPCREQYLTTPAGMNFPLNLKDNSAFYDLEQLSAAGVDSLKIEGRMKKFHYVYTVVNAWRKLLDTFYAHAHATRDNAALYQVFNRDFSNAFLQGDISKELFIDNPRDHSALHFAALKGDVSPDGMDSIKDEIHASRTRIITEVQRKIACLDTAKPRLTISIAGEAGTPLKVTMMTPETSCVICSETALVPAAAGNKKSSAQQLDYASLHQRFGAIHESAYELAPLNLDKLRPGLFLPFKELTTIRKRILFCLNGSQDQVAPVTPPRLTLPGRAPARPRLAVLISERQQLEACSETSADIFYQLPSCFAADYTELVDLFLENPDVTPWFPAVLIGKNYLAALDILERIAPQQIVTDNTGIAHAAQKKGLRWIAGPCLNTVNSFSLLCLKEKFNCSGAFISNEISRDQMKNIVPPADFALYYSIYHPILLMTSRQCLMHQIEGCEKSRIDEDCLLQCSRSTGITNAKGVRLIIEKSAGCYHRIYNNLNFLNPDIVHDLPGTFSAFLIDLSQVKTETRIDLDNRRIISLFEALLAGKPGSKAQLEQNIQPVTNAQYARGL